MQREQAAMGIERFQEWALEPAGLPPPGVDLDPQLVEVSGIAGRAVLVLPEEAPWNQWGPEGRPLLFNDRVALLFEVRIQAAGEVLWRPEDTWLEVNSSATRLPAVPSAEHLLADLQWNALEQEKYAIEGDLVQRTRYAGAFRERFFHSEPGGLGGLIPFRVDDPERHVGALRLRVALTVDGVPRELVWVFQ